MLEKARKNIRKHNLQNKNVIMMNGEQLKFEDNSFDKVVGINKNISSQMVLENLNSIGFDAFLEIVNLINKKNIPDLINAVNSILDQGISGDLFLSGLSSFFRDILVSKNKVSHKLLNLDDTKINKCWCQLL